MDQAMNVGHHIYGLFLVPRIELPSLDGRQTQRVHEKKSHAYRTEPIRMTRRDLSETMLINVFFRRID